MAKRFFYMINRKLRGKTWLHVVSESIECYIDIASRSKRKSYILLASHVGHALNNERHF